MNNFAHLSLVYVAAMMRSGWSFQRVLLLAPTTRRVNAMSLPRWASNQNEELEMLRKENAELKEKLEEKEDALFPLFRRRGKEEKLTPQSATKELDRFMRDSTLSNEIDRFFDTTFSSLSKRFSESIFSFGEDFPQGDIDLVRKAAENEIAKSGHLGKNVQCDSPMQQSYQSTNINGESTKKIVIVCRVRGDKDNSSAIAKIDASVNDQGDLTLNSLQLNDFNLLSASEKEDPPGESKSAQKTVEAK